MPFWTSPVKAKIEGIDVSMAFIITIAIATKFRYFPGTTASPKTPTISTNSVDNTICETSIKE